MAIWNVQSNGNAPSNAQIGDTVRTAGGNYNIVAPNTPGASYNPNSGFWSVKVDTPEYLQSAKAMTNENNQLLQNAADNANVISQNSSAQQYAYNSAEAEKSRNWQAQMSNTSYQRAVEDLKKAGLNPVLAAFNGGASTPTGATASGSSFTGQKAEVDTNLLGLYGSLMQVMMNNETSKDIAKIQAETALQTARLSSAAQVYSADQSYKGARYSSDNAAIMAKYAADVSESASKYASDNSAKSGSWINRLMNSATNWYENVFLKAATPNKKNNPSSW